MEAGFHAIILLNDENQSWKLQLWIVELLETKFLTATLHENC